MACFKGTCVNGAAPDVGVANDGGLNPDDTETGGADDADLAPSDSATAQDIEANESAGDDGGAGDVATPDGAETGPDAPPIDEVAPDAPDAIEAGGTGDADAGADAPVAEVDAGLLEDTKDAGAPTDSSYDAQDAADAVDAPDATDPAVAACEGLDEGAFCVIDATCGVKGHCESGVCKPTISPCDDTNPCTVDLCTAGGCKHTKQPDGHACGASTLSCGVRECLDGQCEDAPKAGFCLIDGVCHALNAAQAGNVCLTCQVIDGGILDPKGFVWSPADGAACEDGNACTKGDACAMGACTPGSPPLCDDANPCTTDACEPTSGCVFLPADGTPCNDTDACTQNDKCQDKACAGTPIVCDDKNVCTSEACDPQSGTCVFVTIPCVDDNPCTADLCDAAGGCQHLPADGTPCDDGDPCSESDACKDKACIGTPVVCDDQNVCTDDACDPTSGVCVGKANAAPCSDGNACTTSDQCSGGSCAGGPAPECDDKNACTADACDKITGCTHTPTPGKACDDGSVCTKKDACDATGMCVGADPIPCDDKNPCSDEACDATTGACVGQWNTKPCDDGNPCTDGDVCKTGSCIPGTGLTQIPQCLAKPLPWTGLSTCGQSGSAGEVLDPAVGGAGWGRDGTPQQPGSLGLGSDPELLARISFDDSCAGSDASSNANHATPSGGVSCVDGKYGKAADLNKGHFQIKHAATMNPAGTALSFGAWVRPNVLTGSSIIVNKESLWEAHIGSPGGTPPGANFQSAIAKTNPGAWAWSGTDQIATNAWTHLAVVYDGAMVRHFVNGVLGHSYAHNGPLALGTCDVGIGARGVGAGCGGPAAYFPGALDEVFIAQRALSQTEVQSAMNNEWAECSLNFNNGTTYMPSGVSGVAGNATTPWVDVTKQAALAVSFQSWIDVEPGMTLRRVEVSTDDFVSVKAAVTMPDFPQKLWKPTTLLFPEVGGAYARVRFHFETKPGAKASYGKGWFVDAVALTAGEHCTNGKDDDGDGFADCGDPDCAMRATCVLWASTFDCGDPIWTASAATGGVAWALDRGRPLSPGYASAPCALTFNDDVDYAASDNGQVKGSMTSGVIDGTAWGHTRARFKVYLGTDVDPATDKLWLEASADDFATIPVVRLLLRMPQSTWVEHAVDLSGVAGSKFKLRFRFDSVNGANNSGPGVFIDDLVIDEPWKAFAGTSKAKPAASCKAAFDDLGKVPDALAKDAAAVFFYKMDQSQQYLIDAGTKNQQAYLGAAPSPEGQDPDSTPGHAGSAFNFVPAASDLIRVVNPPIAETDFTMTAWFKSTGANAGLMSVNAINTSQQGYDRHIWINASGQICFYIWNTQAVSFCGTRNLADWTWHHVAVVVKKGVGATIFIDGAPEAHAAGVGADHSEFTWRNELRIGWVATVGSFNGAIDDAAYFNRPLSQAEIVSLAVLQSGGAYWIDPSGVTSSGTALRWCDMSNNGWTLLSYDTFDDGNAPGWTPATVTTCGAWGKLLGGAGVFGMGSTVTKSVPTLSIPHAEARLAFNWVRIDSWDGEEAQAFVDATQVLKVAYNYWTGSGSTCGQTGQIYWNDEKLWHDKTAAHTGANIAVKFASTLNQGPSDEAWGVDDVSVWVR